MPRRTGVALPGGIHKGSLITFRSNRAFAKGTDNINVTRNRSNMGIFGIFEDTSRYSKIFRLPARLVSVDRISSINAMDARGYTLSRTPSLGARAELVTWELLRKAHLVLTFNFPFFAL